MSNIKIKPVLVNLMKEKMDEENYVYAMCECTKLHEGIKIEKPDYPAFFQFDCPRCGRGLGIGTVGKIGYEQGLRIG